MGLEIEKNDYELQEVTAEATAGLFSWLRVGIADVIEWFLRDGEDKTSTDGS